MYDKCSKCGRQIETADEVKLVQGPDGGIKTLCARCYGAERMS